MSFTIQNMEFYLLVLMRISGFVFTAPFFSYSSIPIRMKAAASFILAIVAQLILRNFITEQIYKNLVTISAILTVLPMANLASPLVVAARIPEVPAEFHDACVPYEEKFPILYDLIITSNDLIMPVDAAVVHPTGVYLYCPNKNVDRRKAEKFLNEMLVGWKLDGNAKVMNEEKKFLRRLSELKTVTEEEDDGSAPHVLKLLKSLSM